MTKSIHILGTGRGVGKTYIANALSRLLKKQSFLTSSPTPKDTENITIIDHSDNPAHPAFPPSLSSSALLVTDNEQENWLASTCGTLLLLPPNTRSHIKGVILNKHPLTDPTLPTAASKLLTLTGIPLLVTLPLRETLTDTTDSSPDRPLTTAILHVPGSQPNHAAMLEHHPAFSLSLVNSPDDINDPDLLLIPDFPKYDAALNWFHQTGLGAAVHQACSIGTPVIGFGSGGAVLAETAFFNGTPSPGLGAIPASLTIAKNEKAISFAGKVNRATGIYSCLSGVGFSGHASMKLEGDGECFATLEGEGKGDITGEGRVLGNVLVTGIHDLFSAEDIRNRLAEELLCRKGLDGWVNDDPVPQLLSSALELAGITSQLKAL